MSGRIWLDDDDHASALTAALRLWASKGMSEARIILDSPCLAITHPLPPLAPPLPDGLRTKAEAARKLGCSTKTLDRYVWTGALHYVALGHGKKRQRKMFADADLDQFIANQTRKDVPCPSTRTRTVARRISTSTSKCEVFAFTALQKRRTSAKPKK